MVVDKAIDDKVKQMEKGQREAELAALSGET